MRVLRFGEHEVSANTTPTTIGYVVAADGAGLLVRELLLPMVRVCLPRLVGMMSLLTFPRFTAHTRSLGDFVGRPDSGVSLSCSLARSDSGYRYRYRCRKIEGRLWGMVFGVEGGRDDFRGWEGTSAPICACNDTSLRLSARVEQTRGQHLARLSSRGLPRRSRR